MTYFEQEVACILVDALGLEDVLDEHDLRRDRDAQFERRLALDVVVVFRVAEDAEDHLRRVLLRVLGLQDIGRVSSPELPLAFEARLTLFMTTSFAARFSGSILSSWPFQYVILIPLLGARMSIPVRFAKDQPQELEPQFHSLVKSSDAANERKIS